MCHGPLRASSLGVIVIVDAHVSKASDATEFLHFRLYFRDASNGLHAPCVFS